MFEDNIYGVSVRPVISRHFFKGLFLDDILHMALKFS